MGATIYFFFPFSLLVSVYVYASLCDFVCIALLFPFVLRFCQSFFFSLLLKKSFFSIFILTTLFYFILLYFILSSSFFLSFFSPFYSEPCGGQVLSAPARRQGCATEVGEPSSGHWSTRDLPAPRNINGENLPEISISTPRPSSTQRPASYSAGHPMPNN